MSKRIRMLLIGTLAVAVGVILIVALPSVYANDSAPPDLDLADSPQLQTTFTAVASGDWSTGSTWDQGSAPTDTDIVVIPAPYTLTVTSDIERNAATTVGAGATLVVEFGAELFLYTDMDNYGTLSNDGGSGTSPGGTLTNYGTFSNTGAWYNYGTIINACGYASYESTGLFLGNAPQYESPCTFTAIATGNWHDPTTWDVNDQPILYDPVIIPGPYTVTSWQLLIHEASITIGVGGSLVLDEDTNDSISDGGFLSGGATNYGTLTNNTFGGVGTGSTLHNYGTLINNEWFVNSGTIINHCGATFTNNATFVGHAIQYESPCAYTAIANGDWNDPATWDTGAVPAAHHTVVIASPYTVTIPGGLSVERSAATTIQAGARLDTYGALTNSGTFTNNGTFYVACGASFTDNGTYSGNAVSYESPCTFTAVADGSWYDAATWDLGRVPTRADPVIIPGPYSLTVRTDESREASTDIQAGATLTINFHPREDFDQHAPLTNSGTLNINGPVVVSDTTFTNNGTFNNYNNFTFRGGTLTNNGTLNNSAQFLLHLNATLDNFNTLVNDGTLSNDATVNNACGATFTNNGTVSGNPVVEGCTLTIVKDDASDSDTAFDFTGDLGAFTLQDPSDPSLTVNPGVGTFAITETPADGYMQTDATCTNGDTPDAVTVNDGDFITCTFVNSEAGTATIIEDDGVAEGVEPSLGASDQIQVNFSPVTTGNFDLVFDPDAECTFTGDPGGDITGTVVPGVPTWGYFIYATNDLVVEGDHTCTLTVRIENSTDALYPDQTVGSITIDITDNDARVTVVKVETTATDTPFEFTSDLGAAGSDSFSLSDPSAPSTSFIVLPGTYAISEALPTGFVQLSATCDNSDAPAALTVAAGDDVTCTFTNEGRGTITIEKQTVPDGDPTFFTFSGDLGDLGLADGGSVTIADLVPDTYSVTEAVPAGWLVTDITCTGDTDGGSTTDLPNNTVDIDLDAGEDITCVVTNTQLGTITIEKQTVPDGDPTFFTFSGDLGDLGLADGASVTIAELLPDTYAVTENLPAGWAVTDITCTGDTDGGSTTDPANGTVNIDLDLLEDITCTFTNQAVGDITIIKSATPADGTSFDFSGDLGAFSLMDGERVTFSALPAGSYAVTESLPPGWSLDSIVCDDPDSTSAGTTATIDLDPSEDITCTFNNASRGTVIIEKRAEPNDTGHVFNFSGDLGGFSLRHGQSATFTVPVGGYAVTEVVPDGWTLKNIRCDDNTFVLNNDTVTVEVEAEQTITCIFNNETFSGGITIYKESIPADGTSFAFGGDLGAFSLADGQQRLFTDLAPGAYTISESAAAGWFLSEVRCASTLGAVDASVFESGVTINLRSTEFVNCVFTNRQQSGIIEIIVDNWPADGTDFGFSGDLGSFVLDDAAADDGDSYGRSIAFAGLTPGSYTISELVPPGWSLLSIRCASSDPASTTSVAGSGVSVNLSGDAFVSCTFSNQASGPNREPVGPREDLGPAPGTVN